MFNVPPRQQPGEQIEYQERGSTRQLGESNEVVMSGSEGPVVYKMSVSIWSV